MNPEPSTWYSARRPGRHRLRREAQPALRIAGAGDASGRVPPGPVRPRRRRTASAPWTTRAKEERRSRRASRAVEPFVTGGYGYIGALADQQRVQPSAVSRRRHGSTKETTRSRPGRTTAWAGPKRPRPSHGGQWVEIRNEYGQLYYAHDVLAVSPEDPTPVPQFFRKAEVQDFGVYLQDSWKAAPGLTINAGLRWDGENTDQTMRGRRSFA